MHSDEDNENSCRYYADDETLRALAPRLRQNPSAEREAAVRSRSAAAGAGLYVDEEIQ